MQNKLTPEQHHILCEKGTEPPWSGEYVSLHDDGMYHCALCDAPLFSSDAKFDSGSGWPSFDRVNAPDAIELTPDTNIGMTRTEVICRSCGGHLGHVFDDGGTETGKRFCVNSRALKFYAS